MYDGGRRSHTQLANAASAKRALLTVPARH
jgi:hypothetical protein